MLAMLKPRELFLSSVVCYPPSSVCRLWQEAVGRVHGDSGGYEFGTSRGRSEPPDSVRSQTVGGNPRGKSRATQATSGTGAHTSYKRCLYGRDSITNFPVVMEYEEVVNRI